MKEKIKNIFKKKISLKKPIGFLIFFLVLISFFGIVYAVGINTIAGGWKIENSYEKTINAFSICKKVSKNGGQAFFIPTKTATEWNSFLNNPTPNAIINNCGGGGGGGGGGTATNGQCALNHYNCNSGTSVNNSDNANDWTWTCQGINGGYNDNCSENKVASCYSDGVCSSTHYGCNFSYSPSNTSETSSQYSWTCSKNGCSSFNCSENKSINGVCDTSIAYGCSVGTSKDENQSVVNDPNFTMVTYTWKCSGVAGGNDSSQCRRVVGSGGGCGGLVCNPSGTTCRYANCP